MNRDRILIADASRTMRAMIRREFPSDQFEVLEAGDGEEALELAAKFKPAFITLGLVLPKLSGLEVCEVLTSEPAESRPHVIIITAHGDTEEHARAFEAGAINVLKKDFRLGELSRYIEHLKHLRQHSRLSGTRILVVDDNAFCRASISHVLESNGANVIPADDGTTGLEMLDEHNPDLVLTDQHMTAMDGIAFVQEIRNRKGHRNTPILLVSATQDTTIAASAIQAGANDFMRKPFDAAELLARVESHARLARLTAELEAKAREAEKANRTKSEFLANMSHEIRTPMTAILGFTDILLANVTKPENTEAASTIRNNGRYLLQLLDDILDLSKIEAGKLGTELAECNPHQLISDVACLMRPNAAGKNVQVSVEYTGAIPKSIRTDATRFKQCLVNLVGNAVKFTEQGSVTLKCGLSGSGGDSQLCVEVIDTGIGIPAEKLETIFDPFAQADNSTTRRFGGSGLGLAITRRTAELLEGSLEVDSRLGEGSIFTLRIATGSLDGVELIDQPIEEAGSRFDAQVQPCSTELNCRILLVEDGPDNQRLISFILEKAGAKVDVAENGQVGVEAALAAEREGRPFDVILMDMQMPIMDGYEAASQLRAQGYTAPIIALTAHAMAGDREKCVSAGCDAYASKPVNRLDLITCISSRLTSEPPGRKQTTPLTSS